MRYSAVKNKLFVKVVAVNVNVVCYNEKAPLYQREFSPKSSYSGRTQTVRVFEKCIELRGKICEIVNTVVQLS